MRLWAVGDFGRTKVERITLLGGAHAPGPAEILLEDSARQTDDYRVGDAVEVETASGETVVWRVAGFAHDLNAVPAMFMGTTTGFIPTDSLAALDEPDGYNTLQVTFAAEDLTRAKANRMAMALRDEVIEPAGSYVASMDVPKPGSHFLGDIFKAVSLLLLALGVLSLFLSGFLVVNTVSALMSQHVRQIGIMKAVGGSAGQVGAMYFGMVAVYGALAVLVGVPTGAWGARGFTEYAAGLLNFRIVSYQLPPGVVALEVAVGFVVPLLAAVIPVTLSTRQSVVRALNAGITSVRFGHGLLDRALGLLRGLPRPIALSLRNTFLRKGRLALTLTTLTLASAVVMGVVSVRGSLLRTVDDLDAWWRYDVQVRFAEAAPSEAAVREALAVGGVTEAETWVEDGVVLARADGTENEQIQLTVLDPATEFVTPQVVRGRWLEAGDRDAVVVNTDLASAEDLVVGDVMNVDVGGEEYRWRVAGVVKGQLMGSAVYAAADGVRVAGKEPGSADRLLVKTTGHSAAEQEAVSEGLEKRLEDAGMNVVRVETQQEMHERVSSEFGILVVFLVIMAALLAAVGVIGLTGTMTINVLESTREIGVMRSTGASHGWIYRIFITEGVTIGFMSWALGLALAYPLSVALVRMLEGAMNIPLTFEFSWTGVAAWFAVVLGISALASLAPAHRASQVSVRDAIAYE
ncbi:MAG: hypothetical protein C0418_05610 [Coriobacteriaceae bacterium]|nr:hypothetical protein [Coriobacteriaceae bacterium]